jgi:hypothetical protein
MWRWLNILFSIIFTAEEAAMLTADEASMDVQFSAILNQGWASGEPDKVYSLDSRGNQHLGNIDR